MAMREYASKHWRELLRYAQFKAVSVHYRNDNNRAIEHPDYATIEQWGADVCQLAYCKFDRRCSRYNRLSRKLPCKTIWRGIIRDCAARYMRTGGQLLGDGVYDVADDRQEQKTFDSGFLPNYLSDTVQLLIENPSISRQEIAELLDIGERALRSRIGEIRSYYV